MGDGAYLAPGYISREGLRRPQAARRSGPASAIAQQSARGELVRGDPFRESRGT